MCYDNRIRNDIHDTPFQRPPEWPLWGSSFVRPTRYAHCGESPQGAVMIRNPRPEEQLREGNEPWERKFEGKSRLEIAYKAGWMDEVAVSAEIRYIIKNP